MNKSMKSSSIRNMLKKLGISEENIKIIDPITEFKEEDKKINERNKNKPK